MDFAAIVRSKDRAWRQIHHGDETEGRQRREQSPLGGEEPIHDERQDAQRTLTNFSARGPHPNVQDSLNRLVAAAGL